jgi:sulfite exporter TauE/SafE
MVGELTLGAALLLGLAGSGHCLAMCGGIAAAFGVSGAQRQPIAVPLAASIGRIAGYATLGALVGAFGAGLGSWLEQPAGIWALRALAALTLVLLGLQLAGWTRLLDRMAGVGAPLWRRLQPISRRLLPIDSFGKALAFGAIWGLLPCGLVYGMLTLSIGFASPVQGALFMGAFGLGTLPALLGLGVAVGRGAQPGISPVLKRYLGTSLALFGVFFFVAPWVLPETGPLAGLRPLLDCH